MKQGLKDASIIELLRLILRKRRRLRITGDSMQPLLKPGEEILIDFNAYKKALPEIGDIVVAYHPYLSDLLIVKRVVSIENNQQIFVRGDNISKSTDSRTYGAINLAQVRGKVTSRFG